MLDLRCVDATVAGVEREGDVDPVVSGPIASSARQPARRPSTARARRRRARLEPREVEQVRDEPVESPHLEADRRQSRPVVRERLARARKHLARGQIAVSGERRSWLTERRIAVLAASLRAAPPPRSRRARALADIDGQQRRRARGETIRIAAGWPSVRARRVVQRRPPPCGARRAPSRSLAWSQRPESSSIQLVRSRRPGRRSRREPRATSPALEQQRETSATNAASRAAARPRPPVAEHGPPARDADRRHEVNGERDPVLRVPQSNVCVGGRNNQLNASMLTTETADRVRAPDAATRSTANR